MRILLVLIMWSLGLIAYEMSGQEAEALYQLLPVQAVGSEYPRIMAIKILDDVKCAKRKDNTYKCILPHKNADGVIQLNQMSSKAIAHKLRKSKHAFAVNLGNAFLACLESATEPSNAVQCSISWPLNS